MVYCHGDVNGGPFDDRGDCLAWLGDSFRRENKDLTETDITMLIRLNLRDKRIVISETGS